MSSKIKELIDSIESGKSENINSAFTSVMADKISTRLDSMKQELAATMFTSKETEVQTNEPIKKE